MYTGQFILAQFDEAFAETSVQPMRLSISRQSPRCDRSTVEISSCAWPSHNWTFRESLRDLITCLHAMENNLYHVGLRGKVSRSTLADANERRDWRIWADFGSNLDRSGETASRERRHRSAISTDRLRTRRDRHRIVPVSVSLGTFTTSMWWHQGAYAHGPKREYTLLYQGYIDQSDRTPASSINCPLEPGAYYIMDRGYNDYGRLYHLHQHHARFVLRAKNNLTTVRRRSNPVDRTLGIRSDQIVMLKDRRTRAKIP